MKRRIFLKSAMALPLVSPETNTSGNSTKPPPMENAPDALYSGLPGLDYALGGIEPGQLICVKSPPCMGKTLMLLDLAARLVVRYGKNVLFYSTHQPSVYISRKLAIRGLIEITFGDDMDTVHDYDGGPGNSASVVLFDSKSDDKARKLKVTYASLTEHPGGCAAVIMDGWTTDRRPAVNKHCNYEDGGFPAERWSHTLLSVHTLDHARRFGADLGIPVILGVTTASLMDGEAQAESFGVESEVRIKADRLLSLIRPEIYRETAQLKPEERNVVCLTGTSPRWWDTRCSRLRFDPRRLGFSTVV